MKEDEKANIIQLLQHANKQRRLLGVHLAHGQEWRAHQIFAHLKQNQKAAYKNDYEDNWLVGDYTFRCKEDRKKNTYCLAIHKQITFGKSVLRAKVGIKEKYYKSTFEFFASRFIDTILET